MKYCCMSWTKYVAYWMTSHYNLFLLSSNAYYYIITVVVAKRGHNLNFETKRILCLYTCVYVYMCVCSEYEITRVQYCLF